MSNSLYTKVLIICICLVLAPIIATTVYMEPESNELTRMGGYLENDFGWNAPQEHFAKPLFDKARSIEDYKRYYDVVVLGDSFSQDESHGWQNYFAKESGLSIINFSIGRVKPDDIINSQIYQEKPPKLFIYEIIERNITKRHKFCDTSTRMARTTFEPRSIPIQGVHAKVSNKYRDISWYSLARLDIGLAINYMMKAMSRELLNIDITEVGQYELSRDDLFSNTASNTLLIITRDFRLKGVTPKQIETAKCSLLSLQAKIKESAPTVFITIVFPNKSSVYSDFVNDKILSNLSIAAEIENTEGLNIAPLIIDYKRAVRSGIVDLYLPNDTHTGFLGYQIAAKSALRLLMELSQTSRS